MSKSLTAEQIVRAAVDAAGEAGGVDEVRAIAAHGAGDMDFAADDMVTLLTEFGSEAEAMYAIQLEAQRRVSGVQS
jgi:hypothetical protein